MISRNCINQESSMMKASMFVFVLLTLIVAVQCQTWTGTYAWDNQCRSRSCCCYSGTLAVTRSGSNLVFTSGTQGCSMSSTSATFTQPRGFSFSTTGVRGAPITYTLSADSNTMTVRNDVNSQCSGSARRTSTAVNQQYSFTLFLMTLFTLLLLFLLL